MWTGNKHDRSMSPVELATLCQALPFVGNLNVYLIVFANTFQIQTKFQIQFL